MEPPIRPFTLAGTIIVIVVSVVSVVIVLAVGATIGYFVWKHKYIQKRRKGKKFHLIALFVSNQVKSKYKQAKIINTK